MNQPNLEGTHYEMGQYYGAQLYERGFRITQLPRIKTDAKVMAESQRAVKSAFPEILEEIRGFADGCKASYDQVAGFILSIGVTNSAPKCSCFAVKSVMTTYFARNHDYLKVLKRHTESSLIVPKGYNAFIGQSDVFIGREDGINEKGLAIGTTFVGGKISKPGINFILAVRCVLEKCGSVSDGVNVLRGMQFSTSQNFVLADQSGNMAVVEAGPEKIAVRYPEPGNSYIIATNNFRDPEMLPFEKEDDRNWYHSLTRYDSILGALQSPPSAVDMDYCEKILSGEHGFVCQYKWWGRIDTLWSVVADLRTLAIRRADGNPSRSKYQDDQRLASLLSHKAD
jgi:predicted choloylglycine hydrolase